MSRIQTVYERHPWQSWFEICFVLALIISIIAVGIAKGAVSIAMAVTLLIELGLILLYWAIGPGKTIPFGHTKFDGHKIKIRRPIIGFKSCEREYNSAEDMFASYRVRTTHYRRALIRI
ncbi:hypothetical protein V8F20_006854 [Naviculisporaceae sp. PSN 640]